MKDDEEPDEFFKKAKELLLKKKVNEDYPGFNEAARRIADEGRYESSIIYLDNPHIKYGGKKLSSIPITNYTGKRR
ncbi:MAG: hypothetical protein AABW81_00575 [Nanoarchaeota archaeon]